MESYLKLYKYLQESKGWSNAAMSNAIKLAQLWHNPLNFDDGSPLKRKYEWDYLFTEALKKERLGNRYYFRFHDYDMTNADEVMFAFQDCPNWKKYVRVWKKYAPAGLRSEAIFLLAVTSMTVKGFKHEEEVAEAHRKAGHTVIKSTPEEDLAGVDFWSDGQPIQVKSPATAAAIKKLKGE